MHPLEALGLGRDADERAVKRAYAQRLKTTRPDEDPAGFQKLHETYQAALAFLRWQAANPGETWWEDDLDEDETDESSPGEASPVGPVSEGPPEPTGMPESEFEALIGNPRFTPVRPEPAPEAPPQPASPPQFGRATEEPQSFSLDLGEFLQRFFAQAEGDDSEWSLQAWLVRETNEWPFWVKPRVAHDVLGAMLQREPSLSPKQLEAVVEFFGLDDVQTGVDPIALEELRQRTETHHDRRRREKRIAHLWRPENRLELGRYMAQPEHGWHPNTATWVVAWLLTNRKAYEWAFWLRPVPFLNRFVMGFLRDASGGQLDLLAGHVDPVALDFWQWGEMRREANRGMRWVVAIVGLIVGLAYVTSNAPERPREAGSRRPARSVQLEDRALQQQFAERIRRANDMELEKGLDEYDAMLVQMPKPPWRQAGWEEIAALVHYNRAVIYGEMGRRSDARTGYESVDTMFARSQTWPVQLINAQALVNLGNLLLAQKEFRDSLLRYQQVVVRYGEIRRAEFDLQVAMALAGRAEAFGQLGEPDEARHALDDLLRRFGDRKEGQLAELVEKARERRAKLDPQGAPPTPTLAPGDGDRAPPSGPPAAQPGRQGLAPEQRLEQLAALDPTRAREALSGYEALIREFPAPWTEAAESIAAAAYLGRAKAYDDMGLADEALSAYARLDSRLSGSGRRDVRLVVARGLNAKAALQALLSRHRDAIQTYAEVLSRYGRTLEEPFELEIARAELGRAGAFRGLGSRDEARRALDTADRIVGRRDAPGFVELRKSIERFRTDVDGNVASRPIDRAAEERRIGAELQRIGDIPDDRPRDALRAYDALLADLSPPFSAGAERLVSGAYFNRALLQAQIGDVAAARATYEKLERMFLLSQSHAVRHTVAMATVNLGRLQFEAGEYDEAEKTYAALVQRGNNVGGGAALELQIAKALLGRCEALGKLNRINEAVRLCDEALERWYSPATREEIDHLRVKAREVRNRIEPPI